MDWVKSVGVAVLLVGGIFTFVFLLGWLMTAHPMAFLGLVALAIIAMIAVVVHEEMFG